MLVLIELVTLRLNEANHDRFRRTDRRRPGRTGLGARAQRAVWRLVSDGAEGRTWADGSEVFAETNAFRILHYRKIVAKAGPVRDCYQLLTIEDGGRACSGRPACACELLRKRRQTDCLDPAGDRVALFAGINDKSFRRLDILQAMIKALLGLCSEAALDFDRP
jgi:hypothetical protein